MKIGVIGISSLTLELACRASDAGYEVIINNPRGGSLIKEAIKKMEPNARIGTLEEAASAEIVLLFLAKDDLENVIQSLPDMTGKIVVHTSGLIFDPHLLLSGITNAMTYKITASLLPQAHVVKLFNPVETKQKQISALNKNKEDIFFIADHSDSRNQIRALLKKLHYLPIDLSTRFHLQKEINLKRFINPLAIKPFKNSHN
ncbi:NAD(P)-binding domain-containing protein [Flavobacterium ginsenosidimutans]|uniref:NAD(P)-binding domain-containing protein n=1 Tax=Flavobacterium ginsenosidimutans TaxID=687844 RepID=UPI000DAD594B|nr:NAD(P)-binding domain-containing protein [Flavobacterium ginsenosidimutans]KAF2328148.1 NAD(P)-binding domain-containing protein [Flavobacterium ginsenosidimutans]